MITKRLLTVFALLFLTLPAHAVLAPNVEESREVAAVTEAVQKRFPDKSIKTITRRDYSLYDVVVGTCRLKARLVTQPMPKGMVGPRRFTVKLSRTKCGASKQ
ncbi:hypothetical protein FHS76_002528 [Ochrobactrum daejeonense]|uniref:Uncharacterized protein n=1 Tax=Brucella daejeonensis TaxID=659015 RepID=A0A7W9ELS2_9HYPH|nr:hypothetical protein [Brucella daejeonensis]MBB5702644.1 hypothetical protein [Brucella daejeonensis]